MTYIPNAHLTDEQLSELLDGTLTDAAASAHVAACATCTARLGDLRAMRAGLRAMHTIADVPDFRLDPGGMARRSAPRVPPPTARAPIASRIVGTATVLCGMALLLLAIFSSTPHAIYQASGAATNPYKDSPCGKMQCPAAGTALTPTRTAVADKPTTPAATVTASPTSTTHAGSDTATTASPPWPALEGAAGVILALGGGILLVRRRR